MADNNDFLHRVSLIPGEAIDFNSSGTAALHRWTNEEIDQKYAAGEVRIVTEQARYPLSTVPALVASEDYELNPEFQRRHRWLPERQSRLIESFIMNVPVPPVFLYENEFGHFEVMDGLQRLTALFEFYGDVYPLEGLTEWPELNGRRYSELPMQVRKGIDRRYLSSIILLRETAKSDAEAERLKQLVFERINSGGAALNDQESRNAIYNGPLNRLCIRLSRNRFLCRMWDIAEPTESELAGGEPPRDAIENERYRTMFDVELVLRFFAHRQRRRIGTGALRTYLDAYLQSGNEFPNETLDGLSKLFEETVELVYDVFGPTAFWLYRHRHNKWGWLERPTTSVYDAMMFVFSQNLHRADAIRQHRLALDEAMADFYKKNLTAFDARQTNMSNIRERDDLFAALVDSILP